MQRRLFKELGDWAVMADARAGRDAARARRAGPRPAARPRAVRPRPGDAGRHQDHHHPRLLREAAAALSAGGRRLARLHGAGRRRPPARSRPRRARTWRWRRSSVPTARSASAYSLLLGRARLRPLPGDVRRLRGRAARDPRLRRRLRPGDGFGDDIWRRCGFDREPPAVDIEAEAVGEDPLGPVAARRRGAAGRHGGHRSARAASAMLRLDEPSPFADVWAIFATKDGEPRERVATAAVDPGVGAVAGRRAGAALARWSSAARRRGSPRPASMPSASRSPTPSSTTAPRMRSARSTSAT